MKSVVMFLTLAAFAATAAVPRTAPCPPKPSCCRGDGSVPRADSCCSCEMKDGTKLPPASYDSTPATALDQPAAPAHVFDVSSAVEPALFECTPLDPETLPPRDVTTLDCAYRI